jgi:HPt (histidine-containing phosphotransfer) domain-containing protein
MSASEYRYSRPDALLASIGGDRNTFMLLVDIYRRDTAEKLASLREALSKGDRAQLVFNTHAMKGTVGPTGADALMEKLVSLEAAGRDPEGIVDAQSLHDVERQVAQVREELERFAARL